MPDQPRRFWWHSPTELTRPWVPALLRGTDEHCNPTVALTVPVRLRRNR